MRRRSTSELPREDHIEVRASVLDLRGLALFLCQRARQNIRIFGLKDEHET